MKSDKDISLCQRELSYNVNIIDCYLDIPFIFCCNFLIKCLNALIRLNSQKSVEGIIFRETSVTIIDLPLG